MTTFPIQNRQKPIYIIAILLSVLFLIYFLGVIIIDDQYEDWVYATSVFSLLLFFAAFPTFLIYRRRSKYMEQIRSGKEIYRSWSCTEKEWRKYLDMRYKLKKGLNKTLFLTILVIGVVIGIIGSLMVEDILILYIVLGLILFLTIPAFLFPLMDKWMMSSHGIVILANKGVYLSGRLYNWDMASAKLKDVSLVKEDGLVLISFGYSYFTLTLSGYDTVYVPLSECMIAESNSIIQFYSKQLGNPAFNLSV
jgi:hypothetical protein